MAPHARPSGTPTPPKKPFNHTEHCSHTMNGQNYHHNHTYFAHEVVNLAAHHNHTHKHNSTHNATHTHPAYAGHTIAAPRHTLSRRMTSTDGEVIGFIVLTIFIIILIALVWSWFTGVWYKRQQGKWAKGQGAHLSSARSRPHHNPAAEYLSRAGQRISAMFDRNTNVELPEPVSAPLRARTRSRGFSILDSVEDLRMQDINRHPTVRTAATMTTIVNEGHSEYSFTPSEPAPAPKAPLAPPPPTFKSWAWATLANKATTALGHCPTNSVSTKASTARAVPAASVSDPAPVQQASAAPVPSLARASATAAWRAPPVRPSPPYSASDELYAVGDGHEEDGLWTDEQNHANGAPARDSVRSESSEIPSYYYGEASARSEEKDLADMKAQRWH